MSDVTKDNLSRLRIEPERKARRKTGPVVLLVFVALLLVVGVVVFASSRKPAPAPATPPPVVPVETKAGDSLLTVTGYVIPRERIEISPKFMGTVRTINVKKGDVVSKGTVIVELEDSEYQARLLEAKGRVALVEANLANAELNLRRALDLEQKNVESAQMADDARRARAVAAAELESAQGTLALAQTYLDWCTIRAPIDGVILEKLVDPNELVAPQSFGGSRGPSTAFVALADLNDLQVEIDLNEADVGKVRIKQRCRISPEAYPDKKYGGYVAEIAPEANRSKGTLQVKVQIEKPDRYLTPELTAKVDFLAE